MKTITPNAWFFALWLTLAAIASATVTVTVTVTATAGEAPGRFSLVPIGTYSTGAFDSGASEIVAHDPATQRLFVVNAQSAEIDILSIANPAHLEKVGSIALAPFGAVANSVAVHGDLVAVAVQATVKTSPGRVVFFDVSGGYVADVAVGALPDCLTFSPDGRYVVVANEGEPNDDYSIDPEGSVSVIEVSRLAAPIGPGGPGFDPRRSLAGNRFKPAVGSSLGTPTFTVRTADFKAFNEVALDPGIRIFGPGASVAMDLEPEYVTISDDSRTAWVTCQENNAIATVDLASATVVGLVGLGFKDHAKVETRLETHTFSPDTLPVIGTTLAGQDLVLGGFSGLHFEGIDSVTGRYRFLTHTDRGPNAEPVGVVRPFLLPDFNPEIVRFELDRGSGALEITERIPLQRAPGEPLTGLPNVLINDSGSEPYNDETPVDLLGRQLALDPLGCDLEGVVPDPQDGSFWMVDEYRPAIVHFDSQGILIERLVPIGTAAAASQPPGTFGDEVLPAILSQRRQNRGFEGIVYDGGKVYAFVQSPLRNPVSVGNGALNAFKNIRVIEFDPASRKVRQFLYVLDNPNLGDAPNTRADKIGDATSAGHGEFLVMERDDDAVPDDDLAKVEKKIYRFNLNGATEISEFSGEVGTTGKTIEQLDVGELEANGIHPLAKSLEVDLAQAGYNQVQKVEGLAMIDSWTLAVINDNDFGVANITVNPDGTFTLNQPPEPIRLGILDLRRQGLDASDRDNQINIRPWPVKGMYLPDGIASYQVAGQTYLITANEGDTREYPAFTESVRLGSASVVLDPEVFPNAAVLKNNSNLGRLNITTTLGRNPATGYYQELYAFGTRSFSIWDSAGKLIFDSGDDLEWITAMSYPDHFNASNTNNTFDNRSDDKGPEPEGITLGRILDRTYAWIGLERIGGILMYDVTDPQQPAFVAYSNFRDFDQDPESGLAGDLGPEGIVFITAQDSPSGEPLLVVGNEVSGTTTVFAIRLQSE